ncbi:hypothetical protein D3C72_2448810 [compost metagenome]
MPYWDAGSPTIGRGSRSALADFVAAVSDLTFIIIGSEDADCRERMLLPTNTPLTIDE